MSSLVSVRLKRMARSIAHEVARGGPSSAPSAASLTATAGHFYPYLEAVSGQVVARAGAPPETSAEDGLPVPPVSLHAGYGGDAASYLACGREHHAKMMEILAASGLTWEAGARALDFGCAAGRLLRCFKELADRVEFWGVDIRAEHIFWCQRHLSPPFRFATTTTFPHLPFEDNSFNLIYACSVFTHIGDLEDAWLLELRRILRPGGSLFATVHDNHAMDVLRSAPPDTWLHGSTLRRQVLELDEAHDLARTGFDMASVTIEPGNHQVFHDRDFLCRRWGRYFRIQSFWPEAQSYQTAVVLRK